MPSVSRVAVLWDSTEVAAATGRDVLLRAATSLRVTLDGVEAPTNADLDAAFETPLRRRAGAVLVTAQTRNYNRPREIAELALRHRVPSRFGEPVAVRLGGLMAYTTDWVELSRTAAGYVDRILRGANPADLPISFATKFSFVVNLQTVRTLGLTIPPAMLLRAQEVIE